MSTFLSAYAHVLQSLLDMAIIYNDIFWLKYELGQPYSPVARLEKARRQMELSAAGAKSI